MNETISQTEKGTLDAMKALDTAIKAIDEAASYNPALYDLRDKLTAELADLIDQYNAE